MPSTWPWQGVASPPHGPRCIGYRFATAGPPAGQQHRREYKRWQRTAPMRLWQSRFGGRRLLGRRSGVQDAHRHRRPFAVRRRRGGICSALRAGRGGGVLEGGAGLRRALGSVDRQRETVSGRFAKPRPVLFERFCRENSVTTRLTKPYTPTTTNKIDAGTRPCAGSYCKPLGRSRTCRPPKRRSAPGAYLQPASPPSVVGHGHPSKPVPAERRSRTAHRRHSDAAGIGRRRTSRSGTSGAPGPVPGFGLGPTVGASSSIR